MQNKRISEKVMELIIENPNKMEEVAIKEKIKRK
uniref:Uncharacterized protein n=1 Tax=viral metagenome TaxID=1070528 RepID=A0A6C0H626_9ZZZZ